MTQLLITLRAKEDSERTKYDSTLHAIGKMSFNKGQEITLEKINHTDSKHKQTIVGLFKGATVILPLKEFKLVESRRVKVPPLIKAS